MRLGDLARLVRSKNAGPFMLTIDVMFADQGPQPLHGLKRSLIGAHRFRPSDFLDQFAQRRIEFELDHRRARSRAAAARHPPIHHNNVQPGIDERQRRQRAADTTTDNRDIARFRLQYAPDTHRRAGRLRP